MTVGLGGISGFHVFRDNLMKAYKASTSLNTANQTNFKGFWC